MRFSFAYLSAAAALFALPLLISAPAHAGISACGDIDVDAQGSCDVRVEGCDVNCSPVNVRVACAAQLEGTCEGSCPQVPSISCTGSCQGSCEADCMAQPAEFDCTASCKADAASHCDAQCASNANQEQCTASCQANVSAECSASCKETPGSASCTAKCQGSCQGSCTAQSKLECQVDCQGKLYAQCQTDVSGGCEADCKNPRGALFCSGQYVDHNGTVDECIAAIKAALPTIKVDVSGQSEGSCSGNTCEGSASGKVSTNCAFSPSNAGGGAAGAFAVFAALGAVCVRRRKQR